MKFIALVMVMFLLQYQASAGAALQRDGWFHRWSALWDRLLPVMPAELRWGLRVLLPALLVGLVFHGLAPLLWGLVALLFAITILVYSLGRGELATQADRYLEAWREGDWQAAWRHARQFVSLENLDETDSPADLHAHACRAVVYQGFERLFAVVFWFMLLGPGGALLYRLASLGGRAGQPSARMDAQILYLLEWLPSRALGLTFALAGNFNTAVQAMESFWLELSCSPADFLARSSAGALEWVPLSLSEDATNAEREAFITMAEEDIRGLLTLIARSGMLWMAVFALGVLWQVF